MQTAMGCGPDMVGERWMVQAFGTEPVVDADSLVFDTGEVRLVYEAFVEPTPTEVFAVLSDRDAMVDASALPSEEVTGTVPMEFDTLVRVPSPSGGVDLFIGVLDGDICFVAGTAEG